MSEALGGNSIGGLLIELRPHPVRLTGTMTWGWSTPDTRHNEMGSACAASARVAGFIASWLRRGRVAAGMNVNVWDMNEHVQALARSSRAAEVASLADLAPRLARWPARLRGES